MSDTRLTLDCLADLLDRARAAGAEAADAVYVEATSLALSHRMGRREDLRRSDDADLGLRVLIGQRQAMVSSSDTSQAALDELVARAVAMARSVPEDPFCGLAAPEQLATAEPDLDLFDPTEPDVEHLAGLAARAEDAARAVPGVTNSEGAEASWGQSRVTLAATNGFARTYRRSRHSLSVSVLAGSGTAMERDYDFTSAVHGGDLESAATIGTSAGHKAVRRLGPRKVETARVPVVFDPRVARGLIGHLTGAINGSSIARGTSFLLDSLGKAVFAPGITIVEDPLRQRGHRSRAFDGEGLPTRRKILIDKGVLTTWVLDLRSARQLRLEPTGNASRGTSSPPGPSTTNVYVEAGPLAPGELMADIQSGFYVTELIGYGVNGVTGDYSRGAGGFWIVDGHITFPVSEVTIAGNLKDMFLHATAAGDLEFRYGTDAPTMRVDGMIVAGQ